MSGQSLGGGSLPTTTVTTVTTVTGAAAAATLTRGAIVQATAVTTPGLTLATPLAAVSVPPFGPLAAEPGSQITVDWSETYQTFLGVGGALTDAAARRLSGLAPAALTAFLTEMFGTNGCSMVRLCLGDSDYTGRASYQTYADNGGVADPNLASFSIAMDEQYVIPILQQIVAINPRVHVLGSIWSYPAWLKQPIASGGTASLVSGNFNPTAANLATAAQYFVKTIQAYAALGIQLWAVAPQNEPTYNAPTGNGPMGTITYPGCGWAPADLATFIGTYLGPAFDAAGLTTKILAGDDFWSHQSYQTTALTTAASNAYLEGTGWHGYGGTPLAMQVANRAYGLQNKSVHLTEWLTAFTDNSTTWIDTMAGVMAIAAVRYGASSLILWNIALDQNGGPYANSPTGSSNCRGVVTINNSTGAITRNIEYYVFAHLCKFVQPGAKVCKSNSFVIGAGTSDVSNVAFRNPDGSIVVFAYNAASTSRTITITDAVTGESFPLTMASRDITTLKWAPGVAVAAGTLTAPTAPRGVTMTLSNGVVTWAWQPPANPGSTDLGGYVLKRGTSAGAETAVPLVVLGGTVLTYVDSTAVAGNTYYGTVTAFGGGGAGPASAEASVAVTAGAPAAPMLGTPVAGNGQLSIPWTSGATNGATITSQAMLRGTASGSETTYMAVTGASPFVDTSATNGTAYYYKMTSTNSVGTSALSDEVSGTASATLQTPAHALQRNGGSSGAAGYLATTANDISTGILDVTCWINLSTYTPSANVAIAGDYLPDSNGTSWGVILGPDSVPNFFMHDSTGTAYAMYAQDSSGNAVRLTSLAISATTGIFLRYVANFSTASFTDSAKRVFAAGTWTILTSPDGSTWTQVGAPQSCAASAFLLEGANSGHYYWIAPSANNVSVTGSVYQVIVKNGATLVANVDFTAQSTGATSFTDSVGNAVTVFSPAAVS